MWAKAKSRMEPPWHGEAWNRRGTAKYGTSEDRNGKDKCRYG